ncbi:MAG: retropepsin-like aspartic protease [Candidatus Omnitrophota bacterium]
MQILNIPFRRFGPNDIPRPWLPVIIINPHANREIEVYGLIDTGADECALPAQYAGLLGHNLQAGFPKEINTGNGKTLVYSHTISIKIDNFTVKNVLIDFMPNLNVPLLGTRSFLSNFVLTIDYRDNVFSLHD